MSYQNTLYFKIIISFLQSRDSHVVTEFLAKVLFSFTQSVG